MKIATALYLEQISNWPEEGRHILAQYDKKSIIVYQAYKPSIARFALEHGYFGGDFKLSRMSWIKPNFLWMMYRSGWGTKLGQEFVLGIRIKLEFFNYILEKAVLSTFDPDIHPNYESWKNAVAESSVRIQWDPDHDPKGNKVNRRAIQLGLRNDVLKQYSRDAIIEIINMNEFIELKKESVNSGDFSALQIPKEEVYIPKDIEVIRKLKLSV